MRRIILIALLFFGVTEALAGGLQPNTVAFLQELGFDPASKQIALIADDQVGEYSLDALAAVRDHNGTKAFIAMRNFVREYLENSKTPFPPPTLYWTQFLKDKEVDAIIDKQKKEGTWTGK